MRSVPGSGPLNLASALAAADGDDDAEGSLAQFGQRVSRPSAAIAVAQGIVRKPKLLMLDEPSAGLSPVLVDRVLAVATQLKNAGTAILLVEQLVEKSLKFADRVCALAQGKVVLEAAADEPDLVRRIQHAYFGSSHDRLH